MRRLELSITDIVDGEEGEKVAIAEGVQFTDGTVVLADLTPRGRAITVYPDGIEALAEAFELEEIIWLDKEPMLIPTPEPSAARHGAEAALEAEAIEHLTAEVWNGDPLPHE